MRRTETKHAWRTLSVIAFGALCFAATPARAFTLSLQDGDFSGQTNLFSDVTGFFLTIEVLDPLGPGAYSDPALGDIEFLVAGALDPTTPARTANPLFTNFAVDDRASLSGQDFYDQGNSLRFEVATGADLGDGLQVSELLELDGSGLVFEFDGRELGTGRYHPPLLRLFADGTGTLENAANTGGVNPVTGVEVNATVGDEYRTALTFAPASLTLAVPEPGATALFGLGGLLLAALRARRS